MATPFLAVDLGAESGRVMAIGWSKAEIALRELHRFPNRPLALSGRLHWNLYALYAEILEGLRRAAAEGVRPVSVGVDTWGIDYALLGPDHRLLALPYCYRDARVEGRMHALDAVLSPATRYALSGMQELPFNTLYQIATDTKGAGAALFAAARRLLFIPDALHYLLSGVLANEYTIASTSQLLGAESRLFDPELCAACGLNPALLGAPVRPATTLGPLSDEVRAATGLGDCLLTAVATHDTASAVAALPSVAEMGRVAYISSGTWSLVGVESERPRLTESARLANLTNEGGLGGRIRLLKNCMGLWIVQRLKAAFEAETPGLTLDYAALAKEAESAAAGLAIIDPDDPSFLAPPNMRHAIDAYLARTGQPTPNTRGGYARLVFESLALRYRRILDEIARETGRRPEVLHVLGGGARNELLNQLTADATGLKVIAGPYEATALGNGVAQALAQGLVASLEEARAQLAAGLPLRIHTPSASAKADAAYARFLTLSAKESA